MSEERIYQSLFECSYPSIEEDIVFKTHPSLPYEVNNYGYIRHLDPDNESWIYHLPKSKTVLIYETWYGLELSDRVVIKFRNNNPYDFRPKNLEIILVRDTQRILKEREFTKNTVDQMLLRELMFGDHRDMEEYFVSLGFPNSYINKWKKISPWYKAKQQKLSRV